MQNEKACYFLCDFAVFYPSARFLMILEHGPERIPETMQKPYKIHYSGAAGRTGEGALKALKTIEKTKGNIHIWSMDRLVQAGPGPAPFTRNYSLRSKTIAPYQAA